LCAISPSTAVLRKSVLLASGGFDESLPACEDYDLWLRLCHRYPVHYVDELLVTRHAGHADQLSQKYPVMDRFRIRALQRLLDTARLGDDDFDAALDTLQTKLDILLKGARKHANHALIEEFEPLQRRWRDDVRRRAC
jgi:hypothetical protein